MRSSGQGCLVALALALAAPSAAAGERGAASAADLEAHLGQQVPLSARFRSSDGRSVTLDEVLDDDKPALLVLAYNRCTMLCSLVLRSVARLLTEIQLEPGEEFSLVTVSIDPRETPHEAARLQAALIDAGGYDGEPERWAFLVGEKPEIDAVAGAVGFRYSWDAGTEQYSHPAVLFTLAPGGAVSGYFDGLAPDPAALEAALSGGSEAWTASLTGAVLECFRFEPSATRHGATVAWLLRGGAAGVGLGVVALILRLGLGARARARRRE